MCGCVFGFTTSAAPSLPRSSTSTLAYEVPYHVASPPDVLDGVTTPDPGWYLRFREPGGSEGLTLWSTGAELGSGVINGLGHHGFYSVMIFG